MSSTQPSDPRAARLAAQLRENLKRRKAQARAMAASPGTGPEADESPDTLHKPGQSG